MKDDWPPKDIYLFMIFAQQGAGSAKAVMKMDNIHSFLILKFIFVVNFGITFMQRQHRALDIPRMFKA